MPEPGKPMSEPAREPLAALKLAISERRYDDAIRDARRLSLEPGAGVETRLLLGEALLAAGRNDEARVELLALVRERPEEAAAHRLLGEAYLRDRHLEAARASLRRAVELNPDDEIARDLLLEADAETAEPVGSTVERWLGQAEPPTTEMAMPEYLAEAPAVTPSASLRSLLEKAQVAGAAIKNRLVVPRPGGTASTHVPMFGANVTAKAAALVPPPSTESVSVELEVDQDASTGRRPHPGRGPGHATPRADATGELSLDDVELAPQRSDDLRAAPPRSVPPSPPSARPPARTESRTPGGVLAPGRDEDEDVTLLAKHPGVVHSDARIGTPARLELEPGAENEDVTLLGKRPGVVRVDASAGPPAPSRLESKPSSPPVVVPPATAPGAAQSMTGAAARFVRGGSPSTLPPEAPSATPRPRAGSAAAPSPLRPPRLGSLGPVEAPEPPTAPAVRSVAPLSSPVTVITAPGPGPSGSLRSTGSVDSVDITRERVRDAEPSASGAALPSSPSWDRAQAAIPAASPPPRLGSFAVPSRRPAPSESRVGSAAAGAGPRGFEPPTKLTWRVPSVSALTRRVRSPQLVAAVVLGGVVLAAVIVALVRWRSARERDELLAVASDQGNAAAVARALAATEGMPAVRARLFATVTVELGEDRVRVAEDLLATAEPSADATLARSLLALARGEAAEALLVLQSLQASGIPLVEAARAQALALEAMGRFRDAQTPAAQAWTLRPAPRHACLLARVALHAGDVASAMAALSSLADGETKPCVRVLRAHLALARGDLAVADVEASVVLGALAERAGPGERAWAHLARGEVALARRDLETARSELRQAGELAPSADETLLLRALSGLVSAGDAEAAHALSARLSRAAPSPPRRAEVLLAIALERRDFAAAEAALAVLPQGARTDLAHGRILEARGDDVGAMRRYVTAAADPALAVEASLRRARVLSRLGRDLEARQVLEVGARNALSDPAVATALAHAALATDDVAAARAALAPVVPVHAAEPRVAALTALLRAMDGEREAPLETASQAAAAAPDDVDVQLDLAAVARLLGAREVEARACSEALRLEPRRFAAVACAVRVALDAADFTRAAALLENARATAPEPQFSRLRAELAVASGSGRVEVEAVRAQLRTYRNDVALLVSLARLQLQAEDTRGAEETARRVMALAPEHPEALYVRAYVAYVDGRFSVAADFLERAQRTARGSSISARLAALRGMLAYEDGRRGDPAALAREALTIDPRCGAAHLLRALIAGRDRAAREAALEAAVTGTDPPAEALARLATSLGPTPRGCELAARYVRMAPSGYDRRAVDDVLEACR